VEADGSCGEQKGFKACKGGEERKLRRAEEIQNSQEWRKTEVAESRGNSKLARVEEDRSSRGQKALKLARVETGKRPQGI
jgi:hypothetical protein